MKGGFKRLVAATDFSEHAVRAAHRAALLAAQHGARVELLHVVNEGPLKALRDLLKTRPKGVARVLADAREALAEAAAALAKATGAPVSPRVEVGKVLQVIARQCHGADLLVLGARGTNPLRDAILGTTAEHLLGRCSRPMLIVKRRAARPYQRVVVGLDFSPASQDALRTALRLGPQAAVTAVHAYDVPFEGKLRLAGVDEETIDGYRYRAAEKAIARIRALAETTPGGRARVAHRVGRGYAPHFILKHQQAQRADLIAVGKPKRPALQEFLLGRVARHVLADSRVDVLVVPA